jgi:hypothetical protein
VSAAPVRPEDDVPEGTLIEVRVVNGEFRARWTWDGDADVYDGEGTGATLDEAVRAAIADLED